MLVPLLMWPMSSLSHTLIQLLSQETRRDTSQAIVELEVRWPFTISSQLLGRDTQFPRGPVNVYFTLLDVKGQALLWGRDLTA